jgi:hypothetical protein
VNGRAVRALSPDRGRLATEDLIEIPPAGGHTLLPRHWAWLAHRPNGTSAALRRLIDEASRRAEPGAASRARRDATYRVVSVLGGNRGGRGGTQEARVGGDQQVRAAGHGRGEHPGIVRASHRNRQKSRRARHDGLAFQHLPGEGQDGWRHLELLTQDAIDLLQDDAGHDELVLREGDAQGIRRQAAGREGADQRRGLGTLRQDVRWC